VVRFGAAFLTGSPWLGVVPPSPRGMGMSVMFGFLTLTLVSSQVATGLA
jgi:simple sugar transport system permease protein